MTGVGDRGNRATEAAADQNVVESARAGIAGIRTILVVTGVSGSGKTTIAKALAYRLGWAFEEGDDLHPGSDIAKMHSGHPLDDRDRWPWLEKVAAWIDGRRQAGKSGVITCSALKRSYRDFLARGRPEVRLLYLHGDIELITARLTARRGHFMPASLLDSQLAALEEPDPDEHPIYADVGRPVEDIIAEIVRDLESRLSESGAAPGGGIVTGVGSDLPLAIEDYALIGDCTTAALVRSEERRVGKEC